MVLIQDPLWGQTKAGPSALGFFTLEYPRKSSGIFLEKKERLSG
jgi:hypothetical protein